MCVVIAKDKRQKRKEKKKRKECHIHDLERTKKMDVFRYWKSNSRSPAYAGKGKR